MSEAKISEARNLLAEAFGCDPEELLDGEVRAVRAVLALQSVRPQPAELAEQQELDFYREHIGNDLDNLLIGAGVLQITHEGGYEACWQNTMDAVERLAATGKQQDGCTESNCRRCLTHPDHRGDMLHAGIGSTGKQKVGESNRTTVDSGALRLELNVLRRAGKDEVAEALESTAVRGQQVGEVQGGALHDARLLLAKHLEKESPVGAQKLRIASAMDLANSPTIMAALTAIAEALAARQPGAQEPVAFAVESPAFENHAKLAGLNMEQHPLHYLFLDPKTYAARQAWKAALEFAPPAQGIDLGQFPVVDWQLHTVGGWHSISKSRYDDYARRKTMGESVPETRALIGLRGAAPGVGNG